MKLEHNLAMTIVTFSLFPSESQNESDDNFPTCITKALTSVQQAFFTVSLKIGL